MGEDNPSISFTANNVDESVIKVMENLLRHGEKVDAAKISNNPNATVELENFQFTLTNPLDRITINPENPLNVIASIGRFTWLMAGNDRLEDIAFYQDLVRKFSDDGLTVPGSNYGKRIFNPLPGIDQVQNVIEMLKKDPNSRRTIIPIWNPQDSDRLESKDIPCAFGISFLIRNNELHMTLMMRSNYGLRLLPVNIFEFTLIGEIVARELEIEFGKYIHYSISMHICEQDVPKVEKWLESPSEFIQSGTRLAMPKMPLVPSPLKQAKLLAKLEAALRNKTVLLDASHVYEHLANAEKELEPYWFEFFKVLCIGALLHAKKIPEAISLSKKLQLYFKVPIISYLNNLQQTPEVFSPATLDPFISSKVKRKFTEIKKAFAPDNEEIPSIIDALQESVEKYEEKNNIELTGKQYRKLEKKYLNRSIVAARSTGKDDNVEDLRKISQKEISEDIKDILSKEDKK